MPMPTKMVHTPKASMEAAKGAPATFMERKKIAQPGDLFIAPDMQHAWLVVRANLDPAYLYGWISIPMDGTPQSWHVVPWPEVTLPDTWPMHPMDHVHFTYFEERKV